jgi:hypothetical protein
LSGRGAAGKLDGNQAEERPAMAEVIAFPAGGYRYLKAVFQYSSGVAAEPGFAIERVRLTRPVPLAEGFAVVERHLAALSRPTTAFCACELRSPKPFTDAGFTGFNREYVKTLERWGIYRDEANPVARTNVCPAIEPPPEPVLHAFSYTVPAKPGARPSFVIAGGGEAAEGGATYRDRIVSHGDTSPDGMRAKIRYVMGEMERRLAGLGFGWADALATQAYSVQDLGPFLADEIVRRGAAPAGLTWHFARPPVEGLEYEMDVRAPARELAI